MEIHVKRNPVPCAQANAIKVTGADHARDLARLGNSKAERSLNPI
jgi:hypothetical protein